MDTQSKSGYPEPTVVISPPGYQGHPPQYAPHPVTTTANVHMGGVIMVTAQMGPKPARVVCKTCDQHIVTTTKPKSSTRTHLIAALFCVTLLWPCVCIPYCVDTCRNTEHYCPSCKSYIGVHVN